ncbi:MAG: Abi-alpha family protein [Gammaproteobacteria bacterium]|nr:Abi-alpha family protein [Gammaproteobacteria bacterium]
MATESKSLDVLGIKPIADSINTVTEGTVNGAAAFLSRICLPAAEEFGLLLRDKVSAWRAKNAVEIAIKAREILKDQLNHVVLHAHPRIIYESIEKGSWAEDSAVQNMWAGLLASSCTKDGKDESNLIFINLLSILTSTQAKIINYACENSKVSKSPGGWIQAGDVEVDLELLKTLTGISDEHQLDHELDHLRSLELIRAGFDPNSPRANIGPLALCLQFYVRAQGFVGSPFDFYKVEEDEASP